MQGAEDAVGASRLWAFLDGYALAGGSHHLAMSPGNHLGRVEKLAEILGIPFVEL